MKASCPYLPPVKLPWRPREPAPQNVTDPQGTGPRPSIRCGLPLPSFRKRNRDDEHGEILHERNTPEGNQTGKSKSGTETPPPASRSAATTGSASPGSFWLEGLPSELICRILACLTTPRDLNSAVQSSRTILQHYLADRKRILAAVLLPALHNPAATGPYLTRYQPARAPLKSNPETMAILPILEALDASNGVPRALDDVYCDGCAYTISVRNFYGAVVAPLAREFPDLNFPDKCRSSFGYADASGRKLVRDRYGRVYMTRLDCPQQEE